MAPVELLRKSEGEKGFIACLSTVKIYVAKGLSTMKYEFANNKSSYSGNGWQNWDFSLRKFTLESEFLEGRRYSVARSGG